MSPRAVHSGMVVTRAVLVDRLQRRLGLQKADATLVVESTLALLARAMAAGDKVKLTGFGQFVIRDKAPRPGRNPRTQVPVQIEARRVVTFRPSRHLRDMMNATGDSNDTL